MNNGRDNMEQREFLERKDERIGRRPERGSAWMSTLGIVGGVALAGLAALVIVALPDIRRYIKISTM